MHGNWLPLVLATVSVSRLSFAHSRSSVLGSRSPSSGLFWLCCRCGLVKVVVTIVVKTWTWLRVAGLVLGLSFSACATGYLISLGNLSWNTNDDTLREVRFFFSLLLSLITGVVLPVASLAVVHMDTEARDGDWSLCKLRKYLHFFRLSRSSATSSTYVFSLPHFPCPLCTVEEKC
jgi:hypothetical protein